MPQDSVGKDFWLIPVLKTLFNIVNISQGLGSSSWESGTLWFLLSSATIYLIKQKSLVLQLL